MAATTAGRILTLCRQFHTGFRISSSLSVKHSTVSLNQLSPLRQTVRLFENSNTDIAVRCRLLHTSCCRRGLDEFFDTPENWGEETVKSGAPWTAKILRTKSNEDLHKLWYVLLKEKNMLLTTEQEAKRQRVQMPSPERLKKVDRSIKRLDTVVKEREDALRLLQTGMEKARPGAWRKDVFGRTYWYRFKEYAIPWYMNRIYKRKRFYTPPFVDSFSRLRMEHHLRKKIRKDRAVTRAQKILMEKFPKQPAKA